jgi:hypothetical protein
LKRDGCGDGSTVVRDTDTHTASSKGGGRETCLTPSSNCYYYYSIVSLLLLLLLEYYILGIFEKNKLEAHYILNYSY